MHFSLWRRWTKQLWIRTITCKSLPRERTLSPGPSPLSPNSMPERLRDVAAGWYRRRSRFCWLPSSSQGAGFRSCRVSDHWPFACPLPSSSPMAVTPSEPLCTLSHCLTCTLVVQRSHPDPQVARVWPGHPFIVGSSQLRTRKRLAGPTVDLCRCGLCRCRPPFPLLIHI